MALLKIPQLGIIMKEQARIKHFLYRKGIQIDKWKSRTQFDRNADKSTIMKAYAHVLDIFMKAYDFKFADLITFSPKAPNEQIQPHGMYTERANTESEVRLVVDGEGVFWFNPGENEPEFAVICEAGEMLMLPPGIRHRIDYTDTRYLKTIYLSNSHRNHRLAG